MSGFNPDFWETVVSEAHWERLSTEDGLWPTGEDLPAGEAGRRAHELWPAIKALIDEVLTERQREVLGLYFLADLNQREIAQRLGISQQAVSEHLYGRRRHGRAVGGAIAKLRRACRKRGLEWA
jgi:RNA polymerase sigma factor (sigma-70 family)